MCEPRACSAPHPTRPLRCEPSFGFLGVRISRCRPASAQNPLVSSYVGAGEHHDRRLLVFPHMLIEDIRLHMHRDETYLLERKRSMKQFRVPKSRKQPACVRVEGIACPVVDRTRHSGETHNNSQLRRAVFAQRCPKERRQTLCCEAARLCRTADS